MKQHYPFWKPFLALAVLGLIGVISLLSVTLPQLDQIIELQPELAELPTPLLAIISLLQPFVLLLIANAIGCLAAPRVGLVSFVYEKAAFGTRVLPRLKPQVKLAVVLGLAYAVVVVVLDLALMPFMGEEFAEIAEQDINLLAQLGMGFLYGGIAEELMLRWGLMALLVWLGWKLLGRSWESPPRGVVWAAVIVAAILFGIGHLPALAAMVPLTEIIVVRTVFLNFIGGVVFGWLFWRHSLEAAMVAHAFTHVGFFIIRLLALAFNGV